MSASPLPTGDDARWLESCGWAAGVASVSPATQPVPSGRSAIAPTSEIPRCPGPKPGAVEMLGDPAAAEEPSAQTSRRAGIETESTAAKPGIGERPNTGRELERHPLAHHPQAARAWHAAGWPAQA